ncbi:hypothetical protein LNY53_29620 [Klebsiella pneumoniae]|nr:hypothetical protein [Klebsiella pneumoniae]
MREHISGDSFICTMARLLFDVNTLQHPLDGFAVMTAGCGAAGVPAQPAGVERRKFR